MIEKPSVAMVLAAACAAFCLAAIFNPADAAEPIATDRPDFAEKSAAPAESLKGQARQLVDVVAVFRL